MRRRLGLALRILVVGACLTYAFWGVDLAQLGRALAHYNPLLLAAAVLYSATEYLILGLRLSFLTEGRAGWATSVLAEVFCLGINNMVPAKLGEVAKAFYLRGKTGIPLGQGLGLIFWERFADLNCLLAAALVSMAVQGHKLAALPMGVMVGSIWACLAAMKLYPPLAVWLVRLAPGKRLRGLAAEVVGQLHGKRPPWFHTLLSLYSLMVWCSFAGLFFILFNGVAGLGLSFGQVMTVFVVCTIGFAMPASPGGLGVFEAAVLLSLGWFGVDKEEALAIGIVFRAIQYIPVTLGALAMLARSGVSLKSLQASEQEPQEQPE